MDLVVVGHGQIVIVQCKAYAKPIGTPVLQIILGAMQSHDANEAVVASLGGFTRNSIDFGQRNKIRLIGPREIAMLQRQALD